MEHYRRRNGMSKERHKAILRSLCCEAQGHRCAYCLADIRKNPTLEHVWPRSKGGGLNYYNVVAACRSCNQSRGNGQIWDQYRAVQGIRRARKARMEHLVV